MQDIYLAFQDESEANLVLYAIIPTEYESGKTGKPTKTIKTESYGIPKYQNIDVIGTVYQPPPEIVLEDYVPIPYPAPNFGVNIRLMDDEDIEPLKPYIIEPKHPIRVWA